MVSQRNYSSSLPCGRKVKLANIVPVEPSCLVGSTIVNGDAIVSKTIPKHHVPSSTRPPVTGATNIKSPAVKTTAGARPVLVRMRRTADASLGT